MIWYDFSPSVDCLSVISRMPVQYTADCVEHMALVNLTVGERDGSNRNHFQSKTAGYKMKYLL